MPAILRLPSRSLIVRLLAPIGIMLALVAGVQLLDGQVRSRIVMAAAAVTRAQTRALDLAELRSVSRSLQRDALNLVTEPDPAARAEIRARFDKRHEDFARRLAALARTDGAVRLGDYFPTQARVLTELGRTRFLAEHHRAAALATFRGDVRPAERHASTIADAAIDATVAAVARAQAAAATLQRGEERALTVAALVLTALAVALAAWLIVATVLHPLADIRTAMDRLAEGVADTAVPHTERLDEIGAMARSIRVFSAAALERDRLRAARAQDDERAREQDRVAAGQRTLEAQRRTLLADLATAVDRNLATVNDKLRRSADRLTRSADTVGRQAGNAAAEAGTHRGSGARRGIRPARGNQRQRAAGRHGRAAAHADGGRDAGDRARRGALAGGGRVGRDLDRACRSRVRDGGDDPRGGASLAAARAQRDDRGRACRRGGARLRGGRRRDQDAGPADRRRDA